MQLYCCMELKNQDVHQIDPKQDESPQHHFRIPAINTQLQNTFENRELGHFPINDFRFQVLDNHYHKEQLNHLYTAEFQDKSEELDRANLILIAVLQDPEANKKRQRSTDNKGESSSPDQILSPAKAIALESNLFIQCLSFSHLVIPGHETQPIVLDQRTELCKPVKRLCTKCRSIKQLKSLG